MFNGIVETIGIIKSLVYKRDCLHLTISPYLKFDDLKIGDSMAVNGVCLTLTDLAINHFNVTVVPETLLKTNLNLLLLGSSVNLERSMKANDRINGHYVQGHVDGVGKIIAITKESQNVKLIKISTIPALNKYIVAKGYIGLDGMSITVIQATSSWFSITLIPHTASLTIAKHYQVGGLINIEVDILGKYIEKIMGDKHAFTYSRG